MKKKSRFSRCYMLFAMLAIKRCQVRNSDKNGTKLTSLVMKEITKKEFGIKSLRELNTPKKVRAFEGFLEKKLYD